MAFIEPVLSKIAISVGRCAELINVHTCVSNKSRQQRWLTQGESNKMIRIVTLMSSLLLSAAVLIACGGANESAPSASKSSTGQSSLTDTPSPPAPSSPGAQAAGGQIAILNMAFTVPPSVRPGQQLTIVNNDDTNHSVTADENNSFDVRVSGGGGIQSFTAPTTPGTYPFHCKYHANMHGLLTVQ
ncbi:MAG: hypothetical protein NVS4B6_02840 [Mycobacterium sp.]